MIGVIDFIHRYPSDDTAWFAILFGALRECSVPLSEEVLINSFYHKFIMVKCNKFLI